MLAFYLSPISLLVLGFILYRLIVFLKLEPVLFSKNIIFIATVALIVCPFSLFVGFLLPTGTLKRFFTTIGNYWLGFCAYFLIFLLIFVIIRQILFFILKDKYDVNKARYFTMLFVPLLTVCFGVYGIANAHNIKITNYDVVVEKESVLDHLKIALVADLHIGYSDGYKQMKEMTDKINELDVDVVVVAGDIFDNEFKAIDEPVKVADVLSDIKSTYGTYYVFGNHDIEEKIFCGFTFDEGHGVQDVSASKEMLDFLAKTGWNLLYDDGVMIEDVYLFGRKDYEKPNMGNSYRLSSSEVNDLINDKISIVVDHEPRELNEVKADLILCGHTHNGQLWPGNLPLKFIWQNSYGYKEFNDTKTIVTSGIGLFGPNMRVGTHAEICLIDIDFKK